MERSQYKIEKIVYLVRHGETEANAARMVQTGKYEDSPLSDLGRKQAEYIAIRAQELTVESVLASPFSRAQETACAVSEAISKPVETSELFRELRYPSELVGRETTDELFRKILHSLEDHSLDKEWRHSDEENPFEIYIRATRALKFLQHHLQKHIFVVTHGIFIKMLVASILMPEWQDAVKLFRYLRHAAFIANTGITIIEYGTIAGHTHWRLCTLNDLAHLPRE